MNSQGTGDISDMLEAIGVQRGCVVSSADCDQIEIANARVTGRFFVDDDGCGFVMRPREWLMQAEAAGVIRVTLEEVFKAWHDECHEGDGVPERHAMLYQQAKGLIERLKR